MAATHGEAPPGWPASGHFGRSRTAVARWVGQLGDPDFGKNAASPYRDKLITARRAFEALAMQSPTDRLSDLRGMTVRVTGVGFFDFNHLQVGRSRSCIELHPMLAIERLE